MSKRTDEIPIAEYVRDCVQTLAIVFGICFVITVWFSYRLEVLERNHIEALDYKTQAQRGE